MKTLTLAPCLCLSSFLCFLIASPSFAKAPVWEPMVSQDDVKIEKFEENAPNGQHNKFNFLVRFTRGAKSSTQALIKDYQEDWIESHSEYGFNDGVLSVKVSGTDLKDKGNGVTEQVPFELKKCFKLNAAMTSFAPAKCE